MLRNGVRLAALYLFAAVLVNAQAPNVDSVRARLGSMAYPRKAMDHQGGTVTLAKPAMRIVSVSSGTDEYLYQIVPPERVVGVSSAAYREEFSAVLPKVRQYKPAVVTDLASLLKLKPDLVLATDSMSNGVLEQARAAGIPVFGLFTNITKLEQIEANIAVIGYLTGADDGAKRELERFRRELSEVETQCHDPKMPHEPARIYAVSMTDMSYGDQTVFQDLMRIVGGRNVAAEHGSHTFDKVDRMEIAQWNPDWVFTWALPGKQDQELSIWMHDENLRSTNAAKNKRVKVFEPRELLPESPLITSLAHILADATCAAK